MDSLVKALVNRVVAVQAEGLKIYGRLLAVSDPQRYPCHKPCVLILETASGLGIIREWTMIVLGKRVWYG